MVVGGMRLSWLVGETKRHTKGRVYEALPLLLADNFSRVCFQRLEVIGIQADDVFGIGGDALRGNRFGQDGPLPSHCVSISLILVHPVKPTK